MASVTWLHVFMESTSHDYMYSGRVHYITTVHVFWESTFTRLHVFWEMTTCIHGEYITWLHVLWEGTSHDYMYSWRVHHMTTYIVGGYITWLHVKKDTYSVSNVTNTTTMCLYWKHKATTPSTCTVEPL